MTFKEMQKDVDDWAQQFETPYWPPHEILARITEEVGETAREVNHLYGNKKKKASEKEGDLGVELCDVMFAIFCMANREGIDLDAAWERVMDKCHGRDKDRYKKK